MNAPHPPDPLSRTLAAWPVVAPRSPHFRTQVRARLEAATVAPPWSVYARRHAAAVGGALVLAVAIGALTGHERARARVDAESERLAAAYVEGLDARAMPLR